MIRTGDLIGRVDEKIGANLHASLTGAVKGVADVRHPEMGKASAIVISGDPEGAAPDYEPADWRGFSREGLLNRIRNAGIIVQNVYTAKTIHDAVTLGKPFYERVVTVSGRGIARPANLLVPIGTHLSDIAAHLGGTMPDLAKVVVGGPMMGFAVSTLNIPVTKTTAGALFLTKDEIAAQDYGPCIRCGFCLDACPMGLEPNNIGIYVEAGRGAETEPFGLMDDCFECGSCAYVCPAKRPLVQFIRLARIQIGEARRKRERERRPARRPASSSSARASAP